MNKRDNLIDIGGQLFIIDLDSFSSLLTMKTESDKTIETEIKVNYDDKGAPIGTTITTREYEKNPEVDGPKYDLFRMCLEILFTYNDELDDSLGFELAMSKTTISFKMAFNTLIEYGILKEI